MEVTLDLTGYTPRLFLFSDDKKQGGITIKSQIPQCFRLRASFSDWLKPRAINLMIWVDSQAEHRIPFRKRMV